MDGLAVISNGLNTDCQPGSIQYIPVIVESLTGEITIISNLIGSIEGLMANQNIELYRGDSRTFKVTVKDENGNAVDITGASIKFSVKERIGDASYVFQKTSAQSSEITITDAANGEYEVYIVPANTQNLDIVSYQYDSELIVATGEVYTIVRGEFTVLAEITRP